MKTEITPGKWSIAPVNQMYKPITPDDHPNRDIILRGGLDKPFEAISIGTKNGQVALIPLDESKETNAKLIVKAPETKKQRDELLEALINITRVYKKGLLRETNIYIECAEQAIKNVSNKNE